MNVVTNVLSCPTEIVVGIIGGRRKRLGSRDGCNIPKTWALQCQGIMILIKRTRRRNARTPRSLRGKPVGPLYNRLLRNDSRPTPILAQNIARFDKVVVIGDVGHIEIG